MVYRCPSFPLTVRLYSRQSRQGSHRAGLLPNPYHVPGREFSLDFIGSYPDLRKEDVDDLVSYATMEVVKHIREHGDGPLPLESYRFPHAPLEFIIRPWDNIPAEHSLTYNDTTAILEAFKLKMVRQGYHAWRADVLLNADDRLLGSALLADA